MVHDSVVPTVEFAHKVARFRVLIGHTTSEFLSQKALAHDCSDARRLGHARMGTRLVSRLFGSSFHATCF